MASLGNGAGHAFSRQSPSPLLEAIQGKQPCLANNCTTSHTHKQAQQMSDGFKTTLRGTQASMQMRRRVARTRVPVLFLIPVWMFFSGSALSRPRGPGARRAIVAVCVSHQHLTHLFGNMKKKKRKKDVCAPPPSPSTDEVVGTQGQATVMVSTPLLGAPLPLALLASGPVCLG